ncbi:MAG: hypothetical protein HRU41_37685 [Saprospiraceae bacterium]|nr:hypothetical protein [Saprospiraceae bacterium]
MTKYWKGFATVALIFMLSCTEGGQTGQKVTQLIESEKIEKLTLKLGSDSEPRSYKAKDVKLEDQFLVVGKEYINLSDLRVIKVKGQELELIIE